MPSDFRHPASPIRNPSRQVIGRVRSLPAPASELSDWRVCLRPHWPQLRVASGVQLAAFTLNWLVVPYPWSLAAIVLWLCLGWCPIGRQQSY
jgi:hypothetical protein